MTNFRRPAPSKFRERTLVGLWGAAALAVVALVVLVFLATVGCGAPMGRNATFVDSSGREVTIVKCGDGKYALVSPTGITAARGTAEDWKRVWTCVECLENEPWGGGQ